MKMWKLQIAFAIVVWEMIGRKEKKKKEKKMKEVLRRENKKGKKIINKRIAQSCICKM